MAIACAGYRVAGQRHHQTTFQARPAAMGLSVTTCAAHFEKRRRKRNQVDYDMADIVSDAETLDLLKKAENPVNTWIQQRHPSYRI